MQAPHHPVWIAAPAARHAILLTISVPSNAPSVLPPGIFLEQQFHGVCTLPKTLQGWLSPLPLSSDGRTLSPSPQVSHSLTSQCPHPVPSTVQKALEPPQMRPAVSQPRHVLSPVCAALSSPFFIRSFLLSEPPLVPQAQVSCPSGLHDPWIPALRAPITLDYKCLLTWEHLQGRDSPSPSKHLVGAQ